MAMFTFQPVMLLQESPCINTGEVVQFIPGSVLCTHGTHTPHFPTKPVIDSFQGEQRARSLPDGKWEPRPASAMLFLWDQNLKLRPHTCLGIKYETPQGKARAQNQQIRTERGAGENRPQARVSAWRSGRPATHTEAGN